MKRKVVVKKKIKRMVFNPKGESEELRHCGYERRGPVNKTLVRMTPDEFLRITYDQVIVEDSYPEYINYLRWMDSSEYNVSELTNRLRSKDVNVDVPHLYIENGKAISHEGRHRAIAAMDSGMGRIPVLLIYQNECHLGPYKRFITDRIKQQRARKRSTMLDRAVRMVRG